MSDKQELGFFRRLAQHYYPFLGENIFTLMTKSDSLSYQDMQNILFMVAETNLLTLISQAEKEISAALTILGQNPTSNNEENLAKLIRKHLKRFVVLVIFARAGSSLNTETLSSEGVDFDCFLKSLEEPIDPDSLNSDNG